MKARLDREFFARNAAEVARELVGARLVHVADGARRAGTIVETEAYLGPSDAACHARFGKTVARAALFGAPGTAYVFLVYGMHHCFNVTCLGEGEGHAVLVRGVAIDGAPAIDGRGPGKLTRALGIDRGHDGVDLTGSRRLYLEPAKAPPPPIGVSARVGIAYAGADARLPLRFFDTTSDAVSRPSPRLVGDGTRARERPNRRRS